MIHVPFVWLALLSALFDAAIAAILVFLPSLVRKQDTHAPLRLHDLVRAAAYVVLKNVVLRQAGIRGFGFVHILYADLVIATPLVGAAVLLASWPRRNGPLWKAATVPVRAASLLSLGLVPVGLYATWIEPFRLQRETARIEVSEHRSGLGTIRIGVLADLQTDRVTDYEFRAVDRLMAERPDIIVLPGDLFQGTLEEFDAARASLRSVLGRLSAPGGVYLVLGDSDHADFALPDLLRSTDVKLLRNESVRVTVRGRKITLGGIELECTTLAARELVHRMEQADGDDDIRILVAHRPDVALEMRAHSRVDLVIAGHTHGGQIVVPGFGPPVTLTRVPRNVAAGGLHAIAGNPTYVSRGVGCERGHAPRVRFLCPPEISLLEVGS